MDIVERLRQEIGGYTDKDIEKAEVNMQEAADEIERLRKDKAELLEALQNIADGPRDVEKSYISLLHEVRSEARDAIAKATGGE